MPRPDLNFIGPQAADWLDAQMNPGFDRAGVDSVQAGGRISGLIVIPDANVANGSYTGVVSLAATSDISASDPVDAIALGPTGRACIIKNFSEIGATPGTPPMLTNGRPVPGQLIRVNTDGTLVVGVHAVEFDESDCSCAGDGDGV